MVVVYYISLVLFVLLCFLLCFIIMIQEGKTSGLGASFGGDAGETLFGTATGDILKRFTSWLAFIFLASCVLLSLWTAALGPTKPSRASPVIQEEVH